MSAMFEAIKEKQVDQNIVKVVKIDKNIANNSDDSQYLILSEYVKMVINKSDDSKGHNSAADAKVPTVKTKKITKPSTNKYSSDTPNRPS